jgi:hypothetical protein
MDSEEGCWATRPHSDQIKVAFCDICRRMSGVSLLSSQMATPATGETVAGAFIKYRALSTEHHRGEQYHDPAQRRTIR